MFWTANGQNEPVNGPWGGNTLGTSSTIEIDTTTSLIRTYGTTIGGTTSWSGTGTQTIQTGVNPPVFPNGPTPIYATGTFSVTITIQVAPFSFDTGFQPYAWDGNFYSFNGPITAATTGTITVAHSFTTGSETVSGTIQLTDVGMIVTGGPRTINVGNYPNSLSVSSRMNVSIDYTGDTVVRALSSGVFLNGFEHSAYFIPEPSSLLLGVFGIAIAARRRRQP